MSMFDEMKELTKKLVTVPSMNGTSGERDIADAIEAYLREIPYFKAHPELVITQDLKDDPLHRRNVMALLKGGDGTERDTIRSCRHARKGSPAGPHRGTHPVCTGTGAAHGQQRHPHPSDCRRRV